MTKDEALRMALEALEADELDMVDDGSGNMVFRKEQAITAIKKSLAQPEQEPVAWEQFYPDIGKPQIAFNAEVIGYVAPQQRPVAWGVFEGNLHDMFFSPSEAQEMADLKGTHAEVRPLYTTPPQRKPLTDEDVERIVREARVGEHGIGYTIARAIEAAHGIKE